MGKLVAAALATVWTSCVLAGCVVEGSAGVGVGMPVSGPPPAPVEERRSPPPGPQVVWIAGYWNWTGMQYAWIPGHWEQSHPGLIWRAPRYSMREGTYFYEPGAWASGADR